MSPRVDPVKTLPTPKPRVNDPQSRMIAEALDHRLLCCAEADEPFTIYGIRDQLLKLPELEEFDPTKLRYRVRDRLNTLEKHGLVVEAGVRGKNRRLFRMNLDTLAETSKPTAASSSPSAPSQAVSAAAPPTPLLEHLEKERLYLRPAMQAAISEAEHYQHLMATFPDERSQITSLLQAAIEHSGRLQGQWDANLKVRQRLTRHGESEVSANQEERS
ncbi:MAG: hypothetical protein ACQEXG_16490 [Pseudomonadota bacterium]